MADLDDGTKDWKQKLTFLNATWSDDIHSNVKLSAYSEPNEGGFDIRNILYDPSVGSETRFYPTVEMLNHNAFQPNPLDDLVLSVDDAGQTGVWIWDHSLFKVDGNIKYKETTYNIKDVEILEKTIA